MIENKDTLEEIRKFLSSGTEKANEIEGLAMKDRFWPDGISHSKIKDKCAEILYNYYLCLQFDVSNFFYDSVLMGSITIYCLN